MPKVTKMAWLMAMVVWMAVVGCLATGCARFHSKTKSYTVVQTTNGPVAVLSGETDMSGYSMFDANQALQKASNQSAESGTTANKFAPGTRISGLNQEANTTNAPNVLRLVVEGVAAGVAK